MKPAARAALCADMIRRLRHCCGPEGLDCPTDGRLAGHTLSDAVLYRFVIPAALHNMVESSVRPGKRRCWRSHIRCRRNKRHEGEAG
jgi:hypothetical protein